ncbi:MAG: SWIM zinc finger family protein [Myxococcota bacterium]
MVAEVTEIPVRYARAPEAIVTPNHLALTLSTDGVRALSPITVELGAPTKARDALLALADVFYGDLRRKASDRSDYLAYLAKSGKKATQAVWDAQKRFLEAQYGEALAEETPLDPIVTASEEGLRFEVFSKDESAYGSVFIDKSALLGAPKVQGSSSLELSPAALKAISKIRAYRKTTLTLAPAGEGEARTLRVPYRFLRAFGDMQTSATLPRTSFALAGVNLYNILYILRRKKAKKPPRGLRYELVPGEKPRIVLEPWETLIEGAGPVYAGTRPAVVRTFGRNRLSALGRLLPHAESVRVSLVGPGLPSYYVIDLGGVVFTLALSGWTDAGFGGIQSFDEGSETPVPELLRRQVKADLASGPRTLQDLSTRPGRNASEVRRALLLLLRDGEALFDLHQEAFRARDLLAKPLPPEKLRFKDPTDEKAHRLLEDPKQVEITKVHERGAEGVSIEGRIEDKAAHRSMKTSFLVDREGRTTDATCTCARFRRSGLREGPCEHMLALKIAHAREERRREQDRGTAEGRQRIRAETRTLVARKRSRAEIVRLSLDDRTVTLRFGDHPDRLRMSRLFFNSADLAREEYFSRLEQLDKKGFIDAGPAGA